RVTSESARKRDHSASNAAATPTTASRASCGSGDAVRISQRVPTASKTQPLTGALPLSADGRLHPDPCHGLIEPVAGQGRPGDAVDIELVEPLAHHDPGDAVDEPPLIPVRLRRLRS